MVFYLYFNKLFIISSFHRKIKIQFYFWFYCLDLIFIDLLVLHHSTFQEESMSVEAQILKEKAQNTLPIERLS